MFEKMCWSVIKTRTESGKRENNGRKLIKWYFEMESDPAYQTKHTNKLSGTNSTEQLKNLHYLVFISNYKTFLSSHFFIPHLIWLKSALFPSETTGTCAEGFFSRRIHSQIPSANSKLCLSFIAYTTSIPSTLLRNSLFPDLCSICWKKEVLY
jgi:hypothetical protein